MHEPAADLETNHSHKHHRFYTAAVSPVWSDKYGSAMYENI